MLVALIAIPCTYAGVVDFWLDIRYPPKRRIKYALVFLPILALGTGWLLLKIPQSVKKDTARLLGVYLGLIVPSFIVLYRLLIGFFFGIGKDHLFHPLKLIMSAYRPFPQEMINALVLEPIPASEDIQAVWQLEDLEIAEIRLLREWAEANREATEKRLLPTTILFAALGLFGDTDPFNNAVQAILLLIQRVLSAENPILNSFGGLMLAWVFVLLAVIFNPIANLIVQSLIIEACLVAEHVQTIIQSQSSPSVPQPTQHKGFLSLLRRGSK